MNIYKNGKFVPMTQEEVKEFEASLQDIAQPTSSELSQSELEVRVEQLEQAIGELREENCALKLAAGLSTADSLANVRSAANAVLEGGADIG